MASMITAAHRGKRYHIAKQYHLAPRLEEYVFSDLMAEVCQATIGDTAYVLPSSTVGIRTLVEHVRDAKSGDKCGYFGDEPGVPAVVPAGSQVVFSSLVFHRSGFNTTDRMRRAYVTQYSPEPIYKPSSVGPASRGDPMHLAVPFLENSQVIYQPQREAQPA